MFPIRLSLRTSILWARKSPKNTKGKKKQHYFTSLDTMCFLVANFCNLTKKKGVKNK
jgi:hypothetical protein